MSRAKGTKNKNLYVREGTDMNMADIAKQLNITQTQAESALKGALRKFRKYMRNNNLAKENYL